MTSSARMTSYQRREQLIAVGRSLFAAKGFEAVSVEEIAAAAKVSKPIVYEHFGGKEGLYAVVVDREMRALTDALTGALADPEAHPRQIVERTALALLTYIEEHAEGFHVLVRDSPTTDPAGSFNSLLGDVSIRVEEILADSFKKRHFPSRSVPYYAQMLVGLTVFTGQYWADRRKVSKEQLAAHIVNLAWYGLSRLQPKPELRFEGERAKKAEQKRLAKEAKEQREQEKREAEERRRHESDTPPSQSDEPTNDETTADPTSDDPTSNSSQSDTLKTDDEGHAAPDGGDATADAATHVVEPPMHITGGDATDVANLPTDVNPTDTGPTDASDRTDEPGHATEPDETAR